MISKARVLAIVAIVVIPFVIYFIFRPLSDIPRPKPPHPLFPLGLNESGDTVYHTIPHFRLQTQLGDTLDSDSLLNHIYVVDFFYTTCPGVCPRLSNQMERVQKSFIKDEKVKFVSISVDAVKDSVPALKTYADAHNAVPDKWYFVRGSREEIFDLAQKGFFVSAMEDVNPEDFLHSEKFILVDYNGNIRNYYNGLDPKNVDLLMGDIVLLLKQIEKGFSFRKDPKKKAKIKDLF